MLCPSCGHPPTDESDPFRSLGNSIRRLFGRPPAPATCSDELEGSETGWTGVSCGCKDPFHGS